MKQNEFPPPYTLYNILDFRERMGNIERWAGPLPQNWHNQQVALQHQILQGMRNMGIIPILPAFAGHVPKAIHR